MSGSFTASRRPCRARRTAGRRAVLTALGATAAIVALLGAGCSTIRRPYGQADQSGARIAGMPDVRAWADSPRKPWFGLGTSAAQLTMLTLSGGGAEGAYGAGFLGGWSDSGSRPRFGIVTGTSVGALMAPFAFLGPEYDPALKDIFTGGQMDSLRRFDGINGLVGSGVFKTAPLKQLIERHTDDALLDAIAAERRKGRLLLVVTTNIDAQRAVIWDMTAIAASDHPGRLELFRRVLIASVSIPGVFAPTFIDVETDGKRFAEMHVDGGVTSNVLAVPEALLLAKLPKRTTEHPKLYIIVNGKLAPDFDVVGDGTLSIVARSFWTAVKANTRSTMIATYEFARRNSWEYRATAIEGEHAIATSSFNFDTVYLRDLFAYGYARGRSGRAWQTAPPPY
jgi:predicted acylesterase/phospholipase RssA